MIYIYSIFYYFTIGTRYNPTMDVIMKVKNEIKMSSQKIAQKLGGKKRKTGGIT